ncbi:MAG: PspC domain-containing protein [Flavobacteriales bacterium]
MKKTLTANISGTVFNIEEDAYEALQRYLATIRSQFAGSPGQDEIMADIEGRIAELFTERLSGRGQVVTMSDVEHIIGVMGQPEDYLGDSEEAAAEAGPSARSGGGRQHKRLFRDADDRWVGGVLGGLAAYIGTDPLWLRIAFIALIVLGVGSPILIYIILWILVPPATTAAERLMMEGEAVTVENLKKAFEEGGKRVAKEVEDLGERLSGEDGKRYAKGFRKGADTAARGASRALAAVVGFVLLLLGVGFAI